MSYSSEYSACQSKQSCNIQRLQKEFHIIFTKYQNWEIDIQKLCDGLRISKAWYRAWAIKVFRKYNMGHPNKPFLYHKFTTEELKKIKSIKI